MLSYFEIRPHLRTGDVVAINTGNRVTQTFQHLFCDFGFAQYTHVGVIVWRGDRLHIAEMDGRANIERALSQYAHLPMQIFPQGIPEQVALNAINAANDSLKHYDLFDFLSVGLRVLFKISADRDKSRLLCTQYAMQILINCGADIIDQPLSPSEVCALLHNGVRYKADSV